MPFLNGSSHQKNILDDLDQGAYQVELQMIRNCHLEDKPQSFKSDVVSSDARCVCQYCQRLEVRISNLFIKLPQL